MLSCLLVVSHPDDDAIFAAGLQSRLAAASWTVVVVTHERSSERGRETLAWQAALSTDPASIHFLGYRDDPLDWESGRCSIDEGAVERDLRALDLGPDLVVTHNPRGEYRHPHHRLTHRVARRVYARVPMLVFAMGWKPADLAIPVPEKRATLERFFPSQREAIDRVAGEVETFAWHSSARPAKALFEALAATGEAPERISE